MNQCLKCGLPGGARVTHVCMTAGRLTDPPAKQAVGWTCPTCGNGNAPWMPYCHNCDASTRRASLAPESTSGPSVEAHPEPRTEPSVVPVPDTQKGEK